MDAVLHRVFSKLEGRDAVIFATLTRSLVSVAAFASIGAVLETSEDTLSFGRWVRRYGKTLASADISDATAISQCIGYVCSLCPDLRNLRLDLKTYDPVAFHFMPLLEHLDVELDRCIDGCLELESVAFPSLQTLRCAAASPRSITLPVHMPSLTSCRLRGLELSAVPTTVPHLKELGLSHCRFPESLVVGLEHLTTLTALDLSGCHLTHAPQELASLVALEDLNLSHNELMNYDEHGALLDDALTAINLLPRLKTLDISHNYLDDVGVEQSFPALRCPLEYLDVACNPCYDLPPGPYLRSLKTLRTSFIPSCIGKASTLRELVIHGHCPKYEPYDIMPPDLRHVSPPKWLLTIHLDDDHISSKVMSDVLLLVKKKPVIGTAVRES